MTFHDYFSAAPVIPYTVKFLRREYPERAALWEGITSVLRGFALRHWRSGWYIAYKYTPL
jgi:hypothetical protein